MADELGPNAGDPEVIAAPEAHDENEPVRNDDNDPVAALASEMGWVPKEEFRGNPEDWKPADEFIRAGRDINRNLSKELRGMRDQIDRVSRTSAQILEDKLAERDAYWRRVQAKAVEDGDNDMVEKAIDERMKLKAAAPAPQSGLAPETQAFIDRNRSWYEGDPLAKARAHEVAERLAAQGYDAKAQLEAAERAIRKEFPEHFGTPAKQPASVTTSHTRNATHSSKAKGFNDMPAESQKMAREYQARHGIKLEDFAKSYWADVERQRRVG